MRGIYRNEGLGGFYRGTFAYLLTHAPAAACSWGTYELSKNMYHSLGEYLLGPPAASTQGARLMKEQIMSATTAALVTSCVINPLDIIKTRIQSGHVTTHAASLPPWLARYTVLQESNVVREMSSLVKYEGMMGLTRGLLPRISLAVPVMIAESCVYELALAISRKSDHNTSAGSSVTSCEVREVSGPPSVTRSDGDASTEKDTNTLR